MENKQNKPAFGKLRFTWKRLVTEDSDLLRCAKQMASCLCDSFVNKHTGRCWPKKATLAKRLSVSKRTVQRYIKTLEQAGYIRRVKVRNAYRAHQICLPDLKGDSRVDRLYPREVTLLSLKGDTAATPNKNQVENIEGTNAVGRPMSSLPISDTVSCALESWKLRLGNHWTSDVFELLRLLRKARNYMLPTRFPKHEDAARYLAFFNRVNATNGKELS
ncbi:helix-turn-helix domain-containing protein [Ruegeria sp.]|uniref:helix-turn-helix domain-containing protein n=1 Tax=Ruegeria sp. TaxID=1879320 RepID=UPI003B00BF1A